VNSYMVSYVLWVKNSCEWCQKATELLNKKAISYTVFTCDNHPKVLKEAKKQFNWETVPIVFEVHSNGTTELIGGYTDLKKHLKEIEKNDSMHAGTNKTK